MCDNQSLYLPKMTGWLGGKIPVGMDEVARENGCDAGRPHNPDRMGDGDVENSVKRERPLTKGLAESVMLNGRPRDQIENIKCPLLNPYKGCGGGEGRGSRACFRAS